MHRLSLGSDFGFDDWFVQDKRVNWHSTPFEARLEKALNEATAEVACTRDPSVF